MLTVEYSLIVFLQIVFLLKNTLFLHHKVSRPVIREKVYHEITKNQKSFKNQKYNIFFNQCVLIS